MSVLVGRQAPNFKAEAVVNGDFKEIQLSDYRGKKNVVLFFYPLDFTFVCPTELHAFQEKLAEFQKRDVEVLACSIDSKFSHFAWLNTAKDQGGISGVKYPLISDIHRTIARDYDVLSDAGVSFRGLFLIDKNGVVRHQLVNDLPLGRNVDEALRLVDALAHVEKHGEVCPANWSNGKDAMKATKEGVSNYLAKH
jgi:peroxiredoxin (alkyl hydroperoxide reductase subunit C)